MTTPAAEAYAKANPPYPAAVVHPLGRELTHADRCDTCGAAAYVRTESFYSTLQLMFRAHHYSQFERIGHFSPETHAILDERPFLTAAVKAQATADTTNFQGKK